MIDRAFPLAGAALLACSLLGACADDPGVSELVSQAAAYRSGGDLDAALSSLRRAAAREPENGEIRLQMAEVLVDLGQGDAAAVSLDQAQEFGTRSDRILLLRAEALLLQEDFFALTNLELPEDLARATRIRLLGRKGDARRALFERGLADERSVTEHYLGLLEDLGAAEDAATSAALTRLHDIRASDPRVERAWQHFACRNDPITATRWQPVPNAGEVIRVGADRGIKTPADAARVAQDGAVVEIDPGDYVGGVANWPQNDLIVRGVGERPRITAAGRSIQDRDVWLFTGDRVTVENVEISGARSPYKNGAGIRHIGADLTLRHVYLHDNENGVLTGNGRPESRILIEFSELSRNGDGEGYAHNIYIGRGAQFELRYSYSHESRGGHLVKSRAAANAIRYNRLSDNEDGWSSYIVDIPEGGTAEVLGNVIQQGYDTLNHGMISFGAEDLRGDVNRLVLANNSIYNRDLNGIVVRNPKNLDVLAVNNLIGGAPTVLVEGDSERLANLSYPEHGMADPRTYDFALTAGARAIDTGSDAGPRPAAEYVHPLSWRPRPEIWTLDVGAYEHCGL